MKRKISENQLTRQEQVVLDEVSKLQIEKEIGDGLCISPDTVNTHINNMKKKIREYGIQVLLIMINVCSLIHK